MRIQSSCIPDTRVSMTIVEMVINNIKKPRHTEYNGLVMKNIMVMDD